MNDVLSGDAFSTESKLCNPTTGRGLADAIAARCDGESESARHRLRGYACRPGGYFGDGTRGGRGDTKYRRPRGSLVAGATRIAWADWRSGSEKPRRRRRIPSDCHATHR